MENSFKLNNEEYNKYKLPETIINDKYSGLNNNDFKVIKQIGQGGFSKTYLAEDNNKNQVAIKKIIVNKTDLRLIDTIENEIKFISNISHPSIPKFYTSFKTLAGSNIEINIVQEYIQGRNLYEIVNDGKSFTEKEVIDLLIKISKILEFLHNSNPQIIHRDIKPSNIMVDDKGKVYLIDFGAIKEKMSFEYTSKSGLSTIIGTQGYMPIEQFENRVNIQSDIYSLGLTIIYLLTKKQPLDFNKKGLNLHFEDHVNISIKFLNIIKKMIEPDYTERYKSINDLKKDLYNIDEKKVISPYIDINDKALEDYIDDDEKIMIVKKPEVGNILKKKNISSVLFMGILSILISVLLFIVFAIVLMGSINLFKVLNVYVFLLLSILFVGSSSFFLVGLGLGLTPIFSSIYSMSTKYILTNKKIIIYPKQKDIKRTLFNLPSRIISTTGKNLIIHGDIKPIIRELPTIIIRLLEGNFDPDEVNEMEARTNSIKAINYNELKNYTLEKIQYKDGSGDLIFYDNKNGNKEVYMRLISVNDINIIEKFLIERFKE